MTVLTRIITVLLLCYVWLPEASAQQPLLSFDLKGKPKKYEDKKLRSEKTGDKKWTILRRFTQNGVTKFNWNFNADQRLNAVLERAKLNFKDDFTQLLPFYNYSLDQTAQDHEVDSVILKTNTGILIHDLRNTWIDNLYMLMGKAYYFKKDFDTAYLTFQYINYVFSPREKDGYDIPIGSNATEGGNAFSISTREKTDIVHKVWSSPPSRNESFIWQIKTYLGKEEYPEAAGMIETLKHDPNFPGRLQTDLYEVQALYFYQQNVYDSAAAYLEKALPNAADKQERARWEYLIAQLYERTNNHQQALEFYDRAVSHTLDPVLEVYGRLNSIRQNKGDEKVIQENIDALVKMARRDRYTNYRDIIYFAAAQMELERNNVPGAKALLLKATQYPNPYGDNANKSRAFLQLAGINFDQKNYPDAKRFYDSVTVVDTSLISQELYGRRKGALGRIVEQVNIMDRQDSLQRIAGLPDAEREAFVRKLAKQLRKQQGLKDEEGAGGASNNNTRIDNNNAPTDLFGNNEKGDWYFYNSGLKSKGFSDFKTKWGVRQNVDNWRRMAAVRNSMNQAAASNPMAANLTGTTPEGGAAVNDFTYEGLLKKLPLTDVQMTQSNDSIEAAQFLLAKAYIDGLEDYEGTIPVLESFLDKFPYSTQRPEALFLLYQCYLKTGNTARANSIADELKQKYAGSPFEKTIFHPNGTPEEIAAKAAMNRKYDEVYNLYIEGSFDQAQEQKRIADSLYGKNYWTPQLLYIQSVYFIHQRQDDSAKASLQNIVNLYPATPMAAKAKTLIDVLGRRKQIEDYLTNLKIERPQEDSITILDDKGLVVQKPDTPLVVPPVVEEQARIKETDLKKSNVIGKDSSQNKAKPGVTDLKRNPLVVNGTPIPQQPVVKDSLQQKPVAVADSLVKARPIVIAPGKPVFTFDPNAPHMVALVMNKVDPVYITEARNAFNRYNKEKYYNKPLQIGNLPVTDTTRLMTVSSFENAGAAVEYVEKARKAATLDLIPWLPVAKYSFIVVTSDNLAILQETKDWDTYKAFLQLVFPGKF
jgi:tetratricopeptide (TPR) repeat protein